MSLTTDRFTPDDLPVFMTLAQAEGWICDLWEFSFLLHRATEFCRVIRDQGEPCAFITAIDYGESAWIGNLLVDPHSRRQGLGRRLMAEAIAALDAVAVSSIWLTASPQGAPLYEHLGFKRIDRIKRWVGMGSETQSTDRAAFDFARLSTDDARGWGTPRTTLLREKCRLGETWQQQDGFIVRHRTDSGVQLGPWGGCPAAAPTLLNQAMAGMAGNRIFLDVPAANGCAGEILQTAGFTVNGATLLMCRGNATGYRPQQVFALGTMGSSG